LEVELEDWSIDSFMDIACDQALSVLKSMISRCSLVMIVRSGDIGRLAYLRERPFFSELRLVALILILTLLNLLVQYLWYEP